MRRGEPVATDQKRAGLTKLPLMPALDGIRAIALITIMVHHAQGVLLPAPPGIGEGFRSRAAAISGGFLGVDVFFVLSGMLITSLLVREFEARRTIAVGGFIWRRMLRLMPALWAMLACHAIYAKATDLRMEPEWNSVRAALLYVSNWAWKWDGFDLVPDLGHLWSLSIEFQFYLVWPFVALLALRADRSGRLFAGVAVAGIVAVGFQRARLLENGDPTLLLYQRTDTRIDSLMIGALLALVWWRRPGWLRPLRWAAWPAAAVVLAAFIWANLDPWLFQWGFIAIAIATALVIGGILSGEWAGERFLAVGALVLVGRVSYGAYLWHLPVYYAVDRYGADWGTPARIIAAVGLTAAVTAASWILIERPVRALRTIGHRAGTRSDHPGPDGGPDARRPLRAPA